LLERFPLRLRVTWRNFVEADGAVEKSDAHERTTRIDETTWEEAAFAPNGETMFVARKRLTTAGIATIGLNIRGELVPYSGPRLHLPIDAHVGQHWESDLALGNLKPRHRACHIDALASCSGGLRVECTSRSADGAVISDAQMFCEGIGWVGYAATEMSPEGKIMSRSWSEDVRDE
jgi:hypothetical protein